MISLLHCIKSSLNVLKRRVLSGSLALFLTDKPFFQLEVHLVGDTILLTPSLDEREDLRELIDFYRMGGTIESDVTADATTLRVTGVTMYLDGLIHGLAVIARRGRHDEDVLEAVRNGLATIVDKPDAVRQRRRLTVIERALYGQGHPYARADESTGAALRAIGPGDLARFKERYYVPANATLVIGGRFDPAQMEQHVRHAFSSWSSSQPAAPRIQEPARAHAVVAGIDNGDATQVTVMLAYPTGAGVDRDHAARLVLISMLEARLYAAVRERLAASYGVGAGHEARVGPGLLIVSGAIDAARGGEALTAVRQVVAGVRDQDGQFVRDFVRARRAVAQRLLADATDSNSLAAELALAALHGKGPHYFAGLVDQVARLKPAEVAALAARELATERETLVVAGARPAVEAAFKAAGLPPAKFVR
jgi:zinc protease